jgi:hypothetical protein
MACIVALKMKGPSLGEDKARARSAIVRAQNMGLLELSDWDKQKQIKALLGSEMKTMMRQYFLLKRFAKIKALGTKEIFYVTSPLEKRLIRTISYRSRLIDTLRLIGRYDVANQLIAREREILDQIQGMINESKRTRQC